MTQKSYVPVALFALLLGGSLQAQGWDYALTMSINNASSDLSNKRGLYNSEIFNGFAGGFQGTNGRWIVGINFRQFKGNNWVVSTIPHTDTSGSSVTAAGTYENRMRKSEAKGFDIDLGYKVNLGLPETFYTFVGARVAMYDYNTTDVGSREVWVVTSPVSTLVPFTLTSASAIFSSPTVKKTNFNPMAGIGYNFNDRYYGQLTFVSSNFAFPIQATSGMITELSFGIKF